MTLNWYIYKCIIIILETKDVYIYMICICIIMYRLYKLGRFRNSILVDSHLARSKEYLDVRSSHAQGHHRPCNLDDNN